MNRQIIKHCFIGLFLLMLAAPELQSTFHLVPIASVTESRAKVPLPAGPPLAELWRGRGYFPDYERHYNDVFGFRDIFIRLRNQIQYSLFRDSDQAIIGKDGWISDRSSILVQQKNVDSLTPDQWMRLKDRIVHLKTILAQRGIYLLVVPVPIKNTVYPEEFPEYSALRPSTTGEEQFRRILAEGNVPYVDVFRIFSDRKRTINVYYRTDNHWNLVGAEAVASAIVNSLAGTFGINKRWRYGGSFSLGEFEGGSEASTMALLWPIEDIEPQISYHQDNCGSFKEYGTKDFTYVGFANRCPGPLLPTTTMFGNSFMLQLAGAGLQDYFSRFYRVHDLSYFHEVLTAIRPGTKIVIWQLFELEIAYQLQSDEWWHEVDTYRSPPSKHQT